MQDYITEDDDFEGSIPKWVSLALIRIGVQKITFSFSGGGDSGQMDDLEIFDMNGGMIPSREVSKALEEIRVRNPHGRASDAWNMLLQAAEDDASACGDYYNNDGGSVYLEYEASNGLMKNVTSDITYYDEDCDEDCDDEEDFEIEDDKDLEP